MVSSDKNLYNAPSSEALRELFHRRLGVNLDPDLVTYTFNGASVVTVTNQALPVGTEPQSSYQLTLGDALISSLTNVVVTRQDWDGLWTLSPTPYTNIIPYSDTLAGDAWETVNVTVTPSGARYAGKIPYWEIASTAAAVGNQAGIRQLGLVTINLGETWTFTVALRATATSSSSHVAVGGRNNVTMLIHAARIVSGPGSVTTGIAGNFLADNAFQSTIGAAVAVSGLSTTEDTLVEVTLVNNLYTLAGVSVGISATAQPAPITTPVSILATRVQFNAGGPKPYQLSGAVPEAAANYTLNGLQLDLLDPWEADALLAWSGDALLAPTVTVTAKPNASDGSVSPYIGSVTHPLTSLSLAQQLPPVVVWSGNYPMTVNALARYLMDAYGYYLEDGEFFGVGDATQTPLVRGATVEATIDPVTRQFYLQATDQSVRWTPGSQLRFQLAVSNSLEGTDGMAFTNTPPEGVVHQPYDFTYTVNGGRAPISFTVEQGTPPTPLNPTTGQMYAAALDTAATYRWIVLATDADGLIARQESTMVVTLPALTFSPPDVNPAIAVGTPVSVDLGVSGGELPLTYAVYSGALPSTMRIENGRIVGTADGALGAGVSTLTVALGIEVTDAVGASVSRVITLRLNDRPLEEIKASLRDKLMHWYVAPATALADGDTWFDATGRMHLTVTGALAQVMGPTGVSALAFPDGFAQSHTTAYNLKEAVALVSWVKTVTPTPHQTVISRSGASIAQYEMAIGEAGNNWQLSLTLDDPSMGGASTYVEAFPSMAGAGAWAHTVLQFSDGVVELVTNAGVPLPQEVPDMGLLPNLVDPLTVGKSASLASDSQYTGHLALIAILNAKLWSDERKWLYKAGQFRAYTELAPSTGG